jgi:hypothetical protein
MATRSHVGVGEPSTKTRNAPGRANSDIRKEEFFGSSRCPIHFGSAALTIESRNK